MATIGNKNGTKGIGINQAQHKPIIPKIKAIIPLVFDIFFPFYYESYISNVYYYLIKTSI